MSELKVNKISPRSGTDVQLGDSGDTFTIPSGATINNQGTATNFGATGSASWSTTVKTGDFTAVAGEGYFVNTTSGQITVTLPASPTAGAVVAIKDYAGTFDTNKCILGRNGSNIGGSAFNANLETEGIAVTLVFVDATKGWLVTDSGLQDEAPTKAYMAATGGTITCSGNCRIHTFTGPGTFTVTNVGNSSGSDKVSYMVVAGGAGGATNLGGGGAGGYREGKDSFVSYTASPITCTSGPNAGLTVPAAPYPIAVGAGGAISGAGTDGYPGSNSTFSTIISAGGGGGARAYSPNPGLNGGSGGGGSSTDGPTGTTRGGGSGNTPPVSPAQGNGGGDANGSTGSKWSSGGGGGAGAVGGNAPGQDRGGNGGNGVASEITASPVTRGGGGGGGCADLGVAGITGGDGGSGGGGSGGGPGGRSGPPGPSAGVANTGGGGAGEGVTSAGAGQPQPSQNGGGSGIVVIRYKFQN